jgi:hypothetical protein
MNFSRSSVTTLVFSFACITLGACTQGTDGSTTADTAADVSATCESRATYDAAIKAANDKLQADYADAMTQFKSDVAAAGAKRDAELNALPNGDRTSDLYNDVITEYNDAVGPNGPIVKTYNDNVKAAQDRFYATANAARDAYIAHPCF